MADIHDISSASATQAITASTVKLTITLNATEVLTLIPRRN
jgi:hypothetical protein